MQVFIKWLLAALGVMITAYILPGVTVENFLAALIAALVIGLVNTFVRPLLVVLTFPLTVMTLGVFMFILNALLVLLADAIVPGFEVENFWWALLFSVVLWIVNKTLSGIAQDSESEPLRTRQRVRVNAHTVKNENPDS